MGCTNSAATLRKARPTHNLGKFVLFEALGPTHTLTPRTQQVELRNNWDITQQSKAGKIFFAHPGAQIHRCSRPPARFKTSSTKLCKQISDGQPPMQSDFVSFPWNHSHPRGGSRLENQRPTVSRNQQEFLLQILAFQALFCTPKCSNWGWTPWGSPPGPAPGPFHPGSTTGRWFYCRVLVLVASTLEASEIWCFPNSFFTALRNGASFQ